MNNNRKSPDESEKYVGARRVTIGNRQHMAMFEKPSGGISWSIYLHKAIENSQNISNRTVNSGIVPHPFDWAATKRFKSSDPHHSSCIEAKISATVGLGFKDAATEAKLDPLSETTVQDVITAAAEDYHTVGNCFIEVVRDGETIVGIFHVAAEDVHIYVEDGKTLNFHYRVRTESGSETVAAAFGKKKEMLERKILLSRDLQDQDSISEIIHIRRPSALNRWYGVPDWLAAVSQIELAQCISQYNYDFFLNNGVPEFIFILSGADLGEVWDKEIVPALKGATGIGNGHSTVAINIPDENVQAVVQKLGVEMADGWFQNMLDTVAVRIVTAHRVPPIITGIQIPGKLGANNEHVNAMWLFQGLVIGPAQKVLQKGLGVTLGSDSGVLGLSGPEPFEFNTITDTIPTARVEMSSSPTEPNKEIGTRKDIPGSAQEETPQERQAAALKKFETRIAKARETLGNEIVDSIISKAMGIVAPVQDL